MAFNEIQVGPKLVGDGANTVARADKSGAIVTHSMHGEYYEAVSRGNVFFATNAGALALTAGLSATSAGLSILNPTGSGINASLLAVSCSWSVVFAAVATIYLAAGLTSGGVEARGTIATVRNARIGAGETSRIWADTAVTLPAIPVMLDTLGVGTTNPLNVSSEPHGFVRWYHGSVVVAPGGNLSFQSSAAAPAGSSFMFCWEEIPIV
jgi:hypothetical protein